MLFEEVQLLFHKLYCNKDWMYASMNPPDSLMHLYKLDFHIQASILQYLLQNPNTLFHLYHINIHLFHGQNKLENDYTGENSVESVKRDVAFLRQAGL